MSTESEWAPSGADTPDGVVADGEQASPGEADVESPQESAIETGFESAAEGPGESRPERTEKPEKGSQGGQSELDLGVISTGYADIDHALTPLEELPHRPVADHPAIFEQVLADVSSVMTDDTSDAVRPEDSPNGDLTQGRTSVSDA